ncbi:MAG TPA: prepilin-type N-terminal cleavage/methylation domain-containing protein [Planctomycetota bacterium]|nr:prepilin-type N-terminal cleavage/methylation domain-containing protein [Planctomycetota bacterium]
MHGTTMAPATVVPAARPGTASAQRGFTLMELLVTMTIISLIFAIVVPNLGAFVPEARLDGSGKRIMRTLDWVRSEARIQGKRMAMEFDLRHARWRIVYPPEQKLTRDQDLSTLEEQPEDWQALETDVVFDGAGDAKSGLAHEGIYRLAFDEYGFTADQVIVLKLQSDATMVWSLSIQGLSGRLDIERSEKGEAIQLVAPTEAAFP